MASLTLHNAYQGCTSLLEYRGSAGDVVALTVAVQYGAPVLFVDLALSGLAASGLSTLAAQLLGGDYVSTLFLGNYVVQANSNGLAQVVLQATSALVAGDVVQLSAAVVGA